MKKVLFVCLGNICRSPLAEAIFDQKCKDRGVADFESDSAGTAAYHVGEQPDDRSVEVAKENGIPIHHKARKFEPEDADTFDYIFAMDQSNYDDIIGIAGKKPDHLYLLREFDVVSSKKNVPDPYYGGIEGFREIYTVMERSIDHFLDQHLEGKV